MRLFQRHILWLSGLEEKHLASLARDANDVTADNENSDHKNNDTDEDNNEFLFSDI